MATPNEHLHLLAKRQSHRKTSRELPTRMQGTVQNMETAVFRMRRAELSYIEIGEELPSRVSGTN